MNDDYRRTVLLQTRSHTISEPYLWTESNPIALFSKSRGALLYHGPVVTRAHIGRKAEIVSVNPGSKREL